jgi:UDP-3-O-[3-hydroxymyristoyl] glucosamine N-acyltransferase
MPTTSYSLDEISKKIHAQLKGDPQCRIDRAEPLHVAKSGAISFLASARYRSFLTDTQASAVILRAEDAEKCKVNVLITSNPELAFSQLLNFLYPGPPIAPGIHASAVIGENCQIDPSATVGPHCVIGDRVRIGARTVIGAGSVIEEDSQIGEYCRVYSRVTLYHGVIVGDRVIIHSGAVVGADGFGLAHDGRQWIKIPQIGRVVIGDDVEIGANTTIDRGALQDTVIGQGVKIDNLVQIGHNVKIGEHTAIAGCVAIAGSTEIGRNCMFGGSASLAGHLEITDGVILTGTAAVGQSIPEPGVYSSGVGVQKNSLWRRNMLRFYQLDDMAKRLRRLEQIKESRDGTDEH